MDSGVSLDAVWLLALTVLPAEVAVCPEQAIRLKATAPARARVTIFFFIMFLLF